MHKKNNINVIENINSINELSKSLNERIVNFNDILSQPISIGTDIIDSFLNKINNELSESLNELQLNLKTIGNNLTNLSIQSYYNQLAMSLAKDIKSLKNNTFDLSESMKNIISFYDSNTKINETIQQILEIMFFSPISDILKSIFDSDLEYIEQSAKIILQETFFARWFPHALFMADPELIIQFCNMIASRKKGKDWIKKIDALILKSYNKTKIEKIRKKWRRTDIENYKLRMLYQAVQAYYRKEYALTVSMLSTLWEDIIYNKVGDTQSRDGKRTKENFNKLIYQLPYKEIISSFFDQYIMYNCHSTKDIKEDVPGRHSVAHGWYKKYPSQKAGLNAILFTDFLLNLEFVAEKKTMHKNDKLKSESKIMDKMKMESVNMADKNIDKIAQSFPNCITETKDENGNLKKAINFDMLRSMLSENIVMGNEAYEFTWVGKKACIAEAHRPIRKTLRPCKEDSVNWDTTENLYIEGDNLDVLKLLQENYFRKVKMIYIDPPYNTGNDFIYRDDFSESVDEYEEDSDVYNVEGNKLFLNTHTNGRFHSDWCSMIYSRLMIARNFLADDGVIFISIDDNEQENLKKICNEVFGEENFVATFPWRKRTAKSDVPFGISQDYEWIVVFAKSDQYIARVVGNERKYYETPDFPNRPWRVHDMSTQRTAIERPNSNFTIINPKNGAKYPVNPQAVWRITKDGFSQYLKENRIIFPGDYSFLNISKPVLRYWKEDDIVKADGIMGMIATSTKLPDDIGMSLDGTKEITDLFNSKIFSYPKTIKLLKYLIDMSTKVDNDAIIMDFFSGSATTAHAVMQLNAEDGGHRKFIMVQLPEETSEDSEAYNAGYKNICEIGKERIRRAGKKIKEETGADIDYGFRVLKLDESNMEDIYYSPNEITQNILWNCESNIKPDRTDLDLLFGCLVEWGLPLSMPYNSEQIDGVTVHTYNNGDLVACFDKNIPESAIKTLAKRHPIRAVFRDSSFSNSAEKVNVDEIFKLLAPNTQLKIL